MNENPLKARDSSVSATSFLHQIAVLLGLMRSLPAPCSFCGRRKLPLAEGISGALICRECTEGCLELLTAEESQLQGPASNT